MITVQNIIDSYRLVGGKLESFDRFELEDITNSQLLIESHLSKSFRAKLQVRFGPLKGFNKCPGSVLFMMALETCHGSVALDIEGAKLALVSLSLSSYHEENVTDCATEAQRIIKLMQSGYALPVSTGSLLLGNFTHTSCEYFNRKVYNLLNRVRYMEHKYKLTDSKAIIFDPEYKELGPLGLVAVLLEWHSNRLADRMWTALIALRQSNVASSARGTSNRGGCKCYICQDPGNLANRCPQRNNNGNM
jgi:hypothetical protein